VRANRTYKSCRLNVTVSWNLLAGFPGERDADYLAMLAAFDNLSHIQPPSSATRIMLQRFSPFFNKPWLGFSDRTPAPSYNVVYDRDNNVLGDMIYMFDSPAQGIDEPLLERMLAGTATWRERYQHGSQLSHKMEGDTFCIIDQRVGKVHGQYRLNAAHQSLIYGELQVPTRISGLVRRLQERGVSLTREQISDVLSSLTAKDLLFEDDGWWLALSIGTPKYRIRQQHIKSDRLSSHEQAMEPLNGY
jgi:hypothetical protein